MSARSSIRLIQVLVIGAVAVTFHTNAGGHVGDSLAAPGDISSFGVPGDPLQVDRFVQISMNDTMRFEPSSVAVVQGETVEFDLKNDGHAIHEFILDTEAGIERHNEVMEALPPMVHAGANMITVMPGERGRVVRRFIAQGTFLYACLQRGHWAAGMMGAVSVTKATT